MPFSGGTLIGTNTGSSGATIAVTVPAAGVPPGAIIIVAVTEKSTTGVNGSVADTAVNSYSISQAANLAALAADGRGQVFIATATKALVSGNTITYTRNTSAALTAISAWYYGGVASEDTAARASATGTTGTITVTSGTPGAGGRLFVGVLCDSGTTTAGGNTAFTQATSWAPSAGYQANSGGSGNARVNGGEEYQSASGTNVYNPTLGSTAQQWALFITALVIPPIVRPLLDRGYKPDELWQGSPRGMSLAIAAALTFPFGHTVKGPVTLRQESDYWQGAPLPAETAILNLLLRAPPSSNNFLVDLPQETNFWQGSPLNANSMYVPQSNSIFAPPLYAPRPPIETPWQGAPISAEYLNLLATGATPFIPIQWEYNFESTTIWTSDSVGLNLPLNVPPPNPFSNEWFTQYEHDNSTYWTGKPVSNEALLQLQEPFSKLWRYDEITDTYWQGAPTANPSLLRIQPTSKLWRYDLNTDTWWQGSPIQNQALLKIQPTSKLWRYDLNTDTYWVGSPSSADTLWMLIQQPYFPPYPQRDAPTEITGWLGAPLTAYTLIQPAPQLASPKQWQWNYEIEGARWQGAPAGSNFNLLGGQVPTKLWRYDFEPDKYWQPYSDPSAVIQLLTAGGEPFSKQWRYDWNTEYPQWQGAPLPAASVHLTPTNPFFKQWRYDYNSGESFWSWSSQPADALFELVEGGVPFFKQWRYDYEADKFWQGSPVQNQSLLHISPFAKLWRYDLNTELPQWQGAPTSAAVLTALDYLPTSPQKLWHYDYDSGQSYWQGAPIQTNISFFPPTKTFSKQWRYDYDSDVRQWTGSPISAATLQALAVIGQPKQKVWRYDLNSSETAWTWQGTNAAALQLLDYKPFAIQWRYDLEPDKYWQGAPIQTNLRFIPTAIPFSKLWRYDTDTDIRQWTGTPASAAALTGLAVAGQPKQKVWRYDYNSGETYWQGSPTFNQVPERLVEPFFKQWRYDFDSGQTFWQGQPIQTNVRFIPITQPFSRLWRYDLDGEVRQWTGSSVSAAALVGLAVVGQPKQKVWRYDYASGETFWQGTPTQNQALLDIQPFKPKWQFNIEEVTYWRVELRRNLSLQLAPAIGVQMDASLTIREDTFWQEPPHRNLALLSLTPRPALSPSWKYYAEDTRWQGQPVAYPTLYYKAAIVVIDPDLVLPSRPIIPGRKDPLVWFGDDLRKTAIPDDPIIPGRKDPIGDV